MVFYVTLNPKKRGKRIFGEKIFVCLVSPFFFFFLLGKQKRLLKAHFEITTHKAPPPHHPGRERERESSRERERERISQSVTVIIMSTSSCFVGPKVVVVQNVFVVFDGANNVPKSSLSSSSFGKEKQRVERRRHGRTGPRWRAARRRRARRKNQSRS